jgi:hypothetical protein
MKGGAMSASPEQAKTEETVTPIAMATNKKSDLVEGGIANERSSTAYSRHVELRARPGLVRLESGTPT